MTTLFCKEHTKSKGAITGCNLAESSKKGYGSITTVSPMMMMKKMMMMMMMMITMMTMMIHVLCLLL
jgi:hypothetical protein